VRFTWGAIYAVLFLYRCGYSVVGQLVVLRLTLIPDTTAYQDFTLERFFDAGFTFEAAFLMESNATVMTKFVAAFFSLIFGGNAILMNIGFHSIAFVGLVYFLRGLEPKTRAFMLVLVMTPSFSLWSSIVSKEAIVVFLVAVLARYVVDIYNNRDRFFVWYLAILGILYMFKPHFIPAILFVAVTSKIAHYIREPAAFALLAGTATLCLLYVMRDAVDTFSRIASVWFFSETGGSQRSVPLISEQYDFFIKAPQGMFRAFVGPTFTEASNGVLQLASFLESAFILAVLAVFVTWNLLRIPVYSAIIALFTIFWIMLANYPLGVANAGTAIRYRTDYILLVFLAVAVLTSRDLYINWRRRPRSAGVATASVPELLRPRN
jgi:hypothetical protein